LRLKVSLVGETSSPCDTFAQGFAVQILAERFDIFHAKPLYPDLLGMIFP
jgi:hypothetical protein